MTAYIPTKTESKAQTFFTSLSIEQKKLLYQLVKADMSWDRTAMKYLEYEELIEVACNWADRIRGRGDTRLIKLD